jgi:hypothetical protein
LSIRVLVEVAPPGGNFGLELGQAWNDRHEPRLAAGLGHGKCLFAEAAKWENERTVSETWPNNGTPREPIMTRWSGSNDRFGPPMILDD